MPERTLDDETVQRIQASIDGAADDDTDVPSDDDVQAAYSEGRSQWSLPEEEAVGYAIDEVADGEDIADDARTIYFGSGGSSHGHVHIEDLEELHNEADDGEGAWLDVKITVVQVWDSSSDAVYKRLQVGDETGRTTLTIFSDVADEMDLSEVSFQEGDAFWVRSAVTEGFNGSVNLKVTSQASIELVDDAFNPEVPEPREGFTAQVTDINSASGLIPRCSVEDCSHVLDSNRCREHGRQDGVEYDLRLKLQVSTGADTYEFIVQREETAALTNINLEQAIEMAQDAADYTIVEDKMKEALHGKTVTGEVLDYGTYVVDEIGVLEATPDPDNVLQNVREMGSLV